MERGRATTDDPKEGPHHPPQQQQQQQQMASPPGPWLVRVTANPTGPKCPFGTALEFTLRRGGCVCLRGPSGRGKTTIATVLAGVAGRGAGRHAVPSKLQMEVRCEWDPSIPFQERCGVLFQQTTLLDDLTVAGNLAVALDHVRHDDDQARDMKIKQLLDAVGLDYDRDASKRPTELSGGMGRRACLALQLAQQKRVIVLDEPFTGLDYDAAVSVARELVHLRLSRGTALLLISHEPHLTKLVMDESRTQHNHVVDLTPPSGTSGGDSNGGSIQDRHARKKPSQFGTKFHDRFLERVVDYTLYSFPLIALAFVA
jgi:ABC-type transporter Mla maintaining outer membrane lipid asymmetry ATPase subunit MlaF